MKKMSLREWLEMKRMTSLDFAAKVKVSPATCRDWVRGNAVPKSENLRAINQLTKNSVSFGRETSLKERINWEELDPAIAILWNDGKSCGMISDHLSISLSMSKYRIHYLITRGLIGNRRSVKGGDEFAQIERPEDRNLIRWIATLPDDHRVKVEIARLSREASEHAHKLAKTSSAIGVTGQRSASMAAAA